MRAMVYSVPGSGTRFACKYLSEVLGFDEFTPKQLAGQPVVSRSFTRYHVDQNAKRSKTDRKIRDAVNDGLAVVVPVRAPVATAITRQESQDVPQMRMLWKALAKNIDGFDHVLLPVEAPWFDRRRLLNVVAKKVGVVPDRQRFDRFLESWEKVGTKGERPERTEYDRIGRTTIGVYGSSVFDEATAWYIGRLAQFAAGPYMGV